MAAVDMDAPRRERYQPVGIFGIRPRHVVLQLRVGLLLEPLDLQSIVNPGVI